MKIIKRDLWSYMKEADAICITTNGFVKSNGEAVMCRGCAYEATKKFPGISKILGDTIVKHGINASILISKTIDNPFIISLFVKPKSALFDGNNAIKDFKCNINDVVPGWACKASLDIIESSIIDLINLTNKFKWNLVVLPLPGCGFGELKKETVVPILEKYLDDRFIVVEK